MSKKMVYNNNTLLLSKRDWLRIGSLAKWAQQGTAPLSENQERIKKLISELDHILSDKETNKILEQLSFLLLTEDDKKYFNYEIRFFMIEKYFGYGYERGKGIEMFMLLDNYNLLNNSTKEEFIMRFYVHHATHSLESLLILFQNAQSAKIYSTKETQDTIFEYVKYMISTYNFSRDFTKRIIDIIHSLERYPQELITKKIKKILNEAIKRITIKYSKSIFRESDPVSLQQLSGLISAIKEGSWGSETMTFIIKGVTQFLNKEIISKPEQLLSKVSELFDNFSETIEEELYDVIMSSLAKYLNELSRGEYAPFHNACKKINRKFSDKIVRYCEEKNYRGLADSLTIMMDHIEIDEEEKKDDL